MNFRKRHVQHLFFLICFSFYVMSPFCYVADRLVEEDAYAHAGNSGGSRVCVVWQLLLSGPFQKGTTGDSGAGVNFLIKKARAVLGKNSPERTPLPEYEMSLPQDRVLREGDFAYPLQTASPSPGDGFHFSFSGLSPPFAYFS